jgi:hypothetical protein
LIKEPMARKQLFSMLWEMMKDGDISGAQFLSILKKHLPLETSDSVISENLQRNVPQVLKNYIPLEHFEKEVSINS